MPSSIDTVIPESHPPLPPSPIEDYDLGHAKTWDSDDEYTPTSQTSPSRKGKAKQYDSQHTDEAATEVIGMAEMDGNGAYPPVNDDAAETRRVEETLRRWELTERQRRKAARDSTYTKPPQTSSTLISDVSSLWRKSSQSRPGFGNHTALPSGDSAYHLPMDNVPNSPGFSPGPSPTPSPPDPESEHNPDNPFANPRSASQSLSPFADPQQTQAVMDPSNDIPDDVAADDSTALSAPKPERPTLLARQTTFTKAPPPKPLGLPPPRTPPPPIDTPPRSVSPLNASRPAVPREEYQPEVRWWHEWLCGCGEGPDRGGDNQAGRTNPME
ncbi:hypothetical protein K435DRAFT_660567 [Dendrothele bispora CBS 962.96]|uniref:Uncharacterized protein n=1 Tax=Dendrothele bispora (strain CBS 962.96) TaxID=1314807 RepID=A0A4V4HGF3_DENBC|nr:hypothetical protein K435DRAFT_660567 [Dendrothele bispora CBS 962.96]